MQSETNSPASETKLHFLDYLRIIRLRKMIIIMVWLLVVITTVMVTNWWPKSYTSVVKMDVSKDATDVSLMGAAQSSGAFDPYFIQTQFERIRSISVLYKVIEEMGLNERWAKRYGSETPWKTQESFGYMVKQMMDVRNTHNTSIIEVHISSPDKEEAAQIAQRIAEIYRDNRKAQNKQQSDSGISAIKEQLEAQSKEVAEMQIKVDELRSKANVVEVSATDNPAGTVLYDAAVIAQMEGKRTEALQRYLDVQTRYEELRKLPDAKRRQAIITVEPDEVLSTLMGKLTLAEQDRVTKEKEFGPTHPEMEKVNGLIKEISVQIEGKVQGIMDGLGARVAACKTGFEALDKEVSAAKKRIQDSQNASTEYQLAKRDLEAKKYIRDRLSEKVKLESVNASIGRQIVDITDPAQVSLKPSWPKMPLNVALAVVVGLILGVGLAFFIEYLDTSVKTIDDVERALQSPVLGVIPQNVGAIVEEGPESPHAEAYRVLRTNLIFARKDPTHNSISVVSGGAGEGKSTTIMNLATIFAQNGQRVLLVDSDLRRPSLHKRLNVSNSLGLTNYLLNQNELKDVIQTTQVPGLDFLPSGRLPSSSLGILNSPQMREFIKEVKQRYDFVFFDSPPIMGVSDASILVSEMDMTLLVIQYRKYPQAMTVRSKQMVDKVGGNLVGVVLNNINISQDAYYYYYSGYAYNDYAKQGREDEKEAAKLDSSKKADLEIKQKY